MGSSVVYCRVNENAASKYNNDSRNSTQLPEKNSIDVAHTVFRCMPQFQRHQYPHLRSFG